MPYKVISGIYLIINTKNNKIYVGSSVNVMRRLCTHRHLLKKKIHFNVHLQASVNKYGIKNFTFKLHERCDNEVLLERENYWIRKLGTVRNKVGYNKRQDATSNLGLIPNKDSRERMRLAHLGHKRNPEAHLKIVQSQLKPVFQIDKTGTIIAEFNSILEAGKSTKISKENISGVCRKLNKTAGGYHWCFKKDIGNFVLPNDLRFSKPL